MRQVPSIPVSYTHLDVYKRQPSVVPQISPSNKQAAFGFGMLNNGTQVTVVGVDKDYYRIKSAFGSYGYVYSYYIGTLNAASYEKQYNQWVGSANSTTGIVNIRTGPSTTCLLYTSRCV